MASERVSGEHMDARTDIYAFGAALYEMATRIESADLTGDGTHHPEMPGEGPRRALPVR